MSSVQTPIEEQLREDGVVIMCAQMLQKTSDNTTPKPVVAKILSVSRRFRCISTEKKT